METVGIEPTRAASCLLQLDSSGAIGRQQERYVSEPMTEAKVLAKLRARYAGDAWAFLTHVPNATGARATRTADAMAMSLWPSRGLNLHGFEVKVSRSDWRRELKAPDKAEAVARYCDRWWLVAGGPGVVLDGELPDGWGLLVVKGARLICEREAPELTPEPIDCTFLAGLLRAATAGTAADAETRAAYERGHEHGMREAESRLRLVEREVEGLREIVETFGRVTGTYMRTWNGAEKAEQIAAALRALMTGENRADQLEQRMRTLAAQAKQIAEAAGAQVSEAQLALPSELVA
jgi:hypothetical protein